MKNMHLLCLKSVPLPHHPPFNGNNNETLRRKYGGRLYDSASECGRGDKSD